MQTWTASSLFWQLLEYRDRTADPSTLGPWLQAQVRQCQFPPLWQLPFAAERYTRTRIAQEAPTLHHRFEALILRWDTGSKTPIHGHPAFSFYYVISGVFRMELFSQRFETLTLESTQLFYAADLTWCSAQNRRYDNFIHRITCLEPGLTFHVYSEDAQQGVPYEHEPQTNAASGTRYPLTVS